MCRASSHNPSKSRFIFLSTVHHKRQNHDDARNGTNSLITQPQEGYNGRPQGYQWIAINVLYTVTPYDLSPDLLAPQRSHKHHQLIVTNCWLFSVIVMVFILWWTWTKNKILILRGGVVMCDAYNSSSFTGPHILLDYTRPCEPLVGPKPKIDILMSNELVFQ